MNITWDDSTSHVLLNTRMAEDLQKEITCQLLHEMQLPAHIWLATSGTTAPKYVALSKNALLTSAEAVNQHLESDFKDIWLNPLPIFHVGGLGIHVRGHLSGAQVISYSERWNVRTFHRLACEAQPTLTSLVPTQVYDLVFHQLQAPSSLRAILVGGGAIYESLYLEAEKLGWHLLPTYGLTECASSVATAAFSDDPKKGLPPLKLLSHMTCSTTSEGFLQIKSPSLLTLYACMTTSGIQIIDPKENGWLITEDKGEIRQGNLQVYGRDSDFVKIGGESSHLTHLQHILDECKYLLALKHDAAIIAVPDERLGHVIHLAVEDTMSQEALQHLTDHYHQEVLPFEKIRNTHLTSAIPRSPLNKIMRPELLRMLCIEIKLS